ncbi:MAG: ATPase, T2SS/T4P/T4SS family [Pirellulaceae bacterium]
MARKKETTEELQLWQTVPPVEFNVAIGDKNEQQALEIQARQAPGYPVAAGQISHALTSRATHVLLDFAQQAVAMRYQIDGMWEPLPPLPRDAGDAMLFVLKQLCGMDPADRRGPQSGSCLTKFKKEKYKIALQSQGVKTGERVMVRLEPVNVQFSRLADLGMRDKMQETYKNILNASGGIVLISAPKGAGLTTTWQVSLEASDRFLRDFQAVEHADRPEPETININPNFFGGSTGKSAPELLRSMILKEPDLFVLPEKMDDESMKMVMGQVKKNDKHVYTRIVADDAVEAAVQFVARHRALAKELAETLMVVTGQRLARRLCDNCKQGFEPSPQLLQRLGIPPGRVGVLYQPFVPPPIEEQVDEKGRPAPITPCHVCGGRSYLGRVGIFELLQPGPNFRAALLKTQDVNKLREIAKAEGHRGLQSEGILTVARGLTGLDELKRVFAAKK